MSIFFLRKNGFLSNYFRENRHPAARRASAVFGIRRSCNASISRERMRACARLPRLKASSMRARRRSASCGAATWVSDCWFIAILLCMLKRWDGVLCRRKKHTPIEGKNARENPVESRRIHRISFDTKRHPQNMGDQERAQEEHRPVRGDCISFVFSKQGGLRFRSAGRMIIPVMYGICPAGKKRPTNTETDQERKNCHGTCV